MVLENLGDCALAEPIQLYCDDLKATNTKDHANVVPENVEIGEKIVLKKHSWNMLKFRY